VAITTFGKILDEFSDSLVKERVGRTYAADSEEEAEWDGFFGTLFLGGSDVCLWALYGDLFGCGF